MKWSVHRIAAAFLSAGLWFLGCGTDNNTVSNDTVTVFTAASTAPVLELIADQFEHEYDFTVEINAASSGNLVRQLQYGNAADVFISASVNWMDTACNDSLVDTATRLDLLGNRLVLVSSVSDSVVVSLDDPGWVNSIDGVLAMGDPAHVPAGAYGRQALEYYGVSDRFADRLSNSATVTAALMLVETGQTRFGIVYENTAVMSETTMICSRFPEASHQPIIYPAALGPDASDAAQRFFTFLRGPYARSMFEEYGFVPLTELAVTEPEETASTGGWFGAAGNSQAMDALVLSLKVALMSVLLLLAPCISIGWLLAKKDFRGKHLLSALMQVPLVIPPVATGYLLLVTFGANSALGGFLADRLGLSFSFNWIAAVLATAVVSMPLLVKSVRVAMEQVDHRIEDAARTLGRSPLATFFSITLPLAWHGIVAGGILCFSRAMGEFGATITFAGNIAGRTRTIPLATYTFIQSPGGEQQAMILIGISIAVSVLSVALVEWLTARRWHGTAR